MAKNDETPLHSAPGEVPRPDADAIRRWLVDKLSRELDIDAERIDVNKPIAHYGVDSALALSLGGELGQWLGRRLDPALVWDYPTIDGMARHLAGELGDVSPPE
jgi:acyl carrier protein